jgi:hypothetical protein
MITLSSRTKPVSLESTVASAAPATPIEGMISTFLILTPNIIKGSRTLFIIAEITPILDGVLVSPMD